MMRHYKNCKLCPRDCGVDRLAGETGFCGETAALRVGAALKHYGEEPPLVGTGGSGTIFISGCNLGCNFCQNWQISQRGDRHVSEKGQRRDREVWLSPRKRSVTSAIGKELYPLEFAKICAALKEKGAININIVTGSHAIPAIVEGLAAAKSAGVDLPVLWNSSGYEKPEALELLRGYVDIFLPDLKTLDSGIAAKYFNAPDYPKTAAAAILKMMELTQGLPEKLIVRHLILPGYLESTRSVLRWFADNAIGKAQLSIMTQYTPIPNRNRSMPNRYVTEEEYNTVIEWLEEYNIEDGFCQELVTGSDWLPDFTRPNPFSSELSVPISFS